MIKSPGSGGSTTQSTTSSASNSTSTTSTKYGTTSTKYGTVVGLTDRAEINNRVGTPAPATFDLLINSKDRASGGTAYDFRLKELYLYDIGNSTDTFSLHLKSISFPNLEPTIRTGVNDVLNLTLYTGAGVLIGTYDFTFDEQYYTALDFAAAFQLSLNTTDGAGGWIVSYNPNSYKFSIVVPANRKIRLTNITDKTLPNYRLLRMTGFSKWALQSLATGTYTSTQTVDFSGTKYVDILTNARTNVITTGNNNSGVVARVPIEVPFGTIVHYQNQDDAMDSGIMLTAGDLMNLHIRLFDEWGNTFLIPDSSEVMIHFKLVIHPSNF